ncbi:MAG: EAL domain-containing protein [Lachnospiraceae bacterium]|nr:EAL domain-containing protein [Lachnospiraceae bacterium]
MMASMLLIMALGCFFEYLPWVVSDEAVQSYFVSRVVVGTINRFHIIGFLFTATFYGMAIYADKFLNAENKTIGKLHSFVEVVIIEFGFWVVGYVMAYWIEKAGIDYPLEGHIDLYSFCLTAAFLVAFWVNGLIFMKREPYIINRYLFVLIYQTLLTAICLITKEVFLPTFSNLMVGLTIIWGYIDMSKLRKYNPLELKGEGYFKTRLHKLYSRHIPFYSVTLCLDSTPFENEPPYVRALAMFESSIRSMGTIIKDADDFLFKNEDNCITALIPIKNKTRDLKKIIDLTSKWNIDKYVRANIQSKILVIECPEQIHLESVYENIVKLFCKRELNRDLEYGLTYFYNSEMKNKYMGYMAIEKALEQLCDDENFDVYYQPIYSTEEGYCSSVEALARFPKLDKGFFERLEKNYGSDVCALVRNESQPDPNNGNLRILRAAAEDFIRMAENKKLIYEIGKTVYRKACEFFVRNDLNKKYGIHYIEINLSLKQCEETTLARDFIRIAAEHGLMSNFINFEITEGIAKTKSIMVNDNLEKLRNARFSFSMDDFGTGYSNLIGIVDDKYSIIKIDKSILDNCFEETDNVRKHTLISPQEREQTMKLLRAVIKMIRGQEKKIVFEGVCDKTRKDTLDSFGGGLYQGFYFSEPLCGERYLEYLTNIGGRCGTADNSKIDGAEYKNVI